MASSEASKVAYLAKTRASIEQAVEYTATMSAVSRCSHPSRPIYPTDKNSADRDWCCGPFQLVTCRNRSVEEDGNRSLE